MDTLEEMQYIAVRDEIRNRIAAFYGVSSVFMVDSGKSGGLNNEGMQILVTNRAVEYGQKVYTEVLFPRLLKQLNISDWKLTLYPNEEEDEITRLRRDEQELNVAQRMAQLGFMPELIEESANRDIRFTYKRPAPQPQQGGAPPPGGMPPGGMPPGGMPPGGMPPGGMPPMMGAGPQIPPQLAQQIMPPPQPGGQGVGLRNRGPAAPERRTTMGSGSPFSNVQQRGPAPTPQQTVSNALLDARRPRGQ
jgi:hypothetical protein